MIGFTSVTELAIAGDTGRRGLIFVLGLTDGLAAAAAPAGRTAAKLFDHDPESIRAGR